MFLAAPAGAAEAERMAEALEAVKQRDFPLARTLAAQAGSTVAEDVIEWHQLRAGDGRWTDYAGFLGRNADWPGLRLMRRRAERVMPSGLPGDQVRAFFSATKPQTGRGAMIYLTALSGEARAAELSRAWRELPMSKSERATFLERYRSELKPHHVARLDQMLWTGEGDRAEELLSLVSKGEAALARARIALQADARGVDALIKAVPVSHAGDPGLAYDRFRWRMRKGRWESAEQLMLERSTSAAALGRPDAWASNRRAIARRAMRQGRPRAAYRAASQHFLTAGAAYADLEWLSGYLALRYMDDPRRALTHFTAFRGAVETPISLGRAGYWTGRAHEALGNEAAAREAYGFAAAYQTSFYGQLATERARLPIDLSIARRGGLPDWNARDFARSGPVQAARLLMAAGDPLTAQRFLLHVEEGLGAADTAALAKLAYDIGLTSTKVRIAKRLARKGVIAPEAYYPVTDLAFQARSVAAELAMAVARQESELNPLAISPAGARGLMQLMPATARKMSEKLDLTYSAERLTADPAYNARLGTAYLAEMLERYNGSVILAAAAYNAGPGRVDRWIGELGDPRSPGADPIDWIEHIPFRETRNYVMRVLESLHVYRTRIGGGADGIGLMARITPRG